MKIHNGLPLFLECLNRWEKCPSERVFNVEYAQPMSSMVGDFFEDYHEVLTELDWKTYRTDTLRLNPEKEEARVVHLLAQVENLFGFKLAGDIFIIGAFAGMDGYARFEKGSHRVFLGVDESFERGKYLDVLITHELTHVARESRPEVWEGWGLNPKMTNSEFTDSQPVIEHLVGEGFSCVVSEILVPGGGAWNYAYQDPDSFHRVLLNAKLMDKAIHAEIRDPNGDYGNLYGIRPSLAHYVWAWQWVKQLLATRCGNDPRKLVEVCSKEFIPDALEFQLSEFASSLMKNQ